MARRGRRRKRSRSARNRKLRRSGNFKWPNYQSFPWGPHGRVSWPEQIFHATRRGTGLHPRFEGITVSESLVESPTTPTAQKVADGFQTENNPAIGEWFGDGEEPGVVEVTNPNQFVWYPTTNGNG